MIMINYKIIQSKLLNEKIVLIEDDIKFNRGVSKDGTMAVYTMDEVELIKGSSPEHKKAVNIVKRLFNGKIIKEDKK